MKFRLFWQNSRWALVLSCSVLLLVLIGVLTQAAAAEVSADAALEVPHDDPPPIPGTPEPLPDDYWSYSVKVVCDGEYGQRRNTIINIFNPSHTTSTLALGNEFTVVGPIVFRPPSTRPLVALAPVLMSLPGLNATTIDCTHLNLPSPVLTEGFVNIFSAKPLDIVAVYMGQENENVEVEHVPGRYVIGGAAQPNGWEQP